RAARVGGHARAPRQPEADAVVQLLRHLEPVRAVGPEEPGTIMAFGGVIDVTAADGMARDLASILPGRLRAPRTPTVSRSAGLCDEFVHRLVTGIFRESGLAAAVAASPGTVDDLVGRAGLEPRRASAPVDWMLRRLCARGIVERSGAPPPLRLSGAGAGPGAGSGAGARGAGAPGSVMAADVRAGRDRREGLSGVPARRAQR